MVCCRAPLSASNKRAVESRLVVATRVPSGESTVRVTSSAWAFTSHASDQLLVCHDAKCPSA